MQVILPHVLFGELIRTPAKVASEIFDGVKVALDSQDSRERGLADKS